MGMKEKNKKTTTFCLVKEFGDYLKYQSMHGNKVFEVDHYTTYLSICASLEKNTVATPFGVENTEIEHLMAYDDWKVEMQNLNGV